MKLRLACVGLFLALAPLFAAETPFSQTLDAAAKQRLGLAALSPAQLAALDAAVAAYQSGAQEVAVKTAVAVVEKQAEQKVQQAEKKAAETAVAEYKKQEEPGVIARTLEVFKRKSDDGSRERFTARVVGTFRGWHGGTYFPLDNGQVWRQAGTENNVQPPVPNAEVEIYQSGNGYWRLKYGGAWITVKRLQ